MFGLPALTVLIGLAMIEISYIPVRDGRLYLSRANSTVTLLREYANGI